jgi:hypothetical protein
LLRLTASATKSLETLWQESGTGFAAKVWCERERIFGAPEQRSAPWQMPAPLFNAAYVTQIYCTEPEQFFSGLSPDVNDGEIMISTKRLATVSAITWLIAFALAKTRKTSRQRDSKLQGQQMTTWEGEGGNLQPAQPVAAHIAVH